MVAGLVAADWQSVLAQQQTTQGAFGPRTTGGGGTSRSRSFSGGSNTGGGGLNLGQGFNIGGNSGSMGRSSGMGMGQGMAGGGNSRSAFARGSTNRQANQFVGSDGQELQRFIGALSGTSGAGGRGMGQTGMGGRGAMGRTMGGRGMGQEMFGDQFDEGQFGNQGDDARSQRARMRVRTTIGFQHPPIASSPQRSAALTGRLVKLLTSRTGNALSVELTGRTAILRGNVPTDHDRIVAEQLLLLEPGVGQVQNDLVVAGESSPAPAARVFSPTLSSPVVVTPRAPASAVAPPAAVVVPPGSVIVPPEGAPPIVVPPVIAPTLDQPSVVVPAPVVVPPAAEGPGVPL
jgi:hypothetical protein